MKDTGKAVRMCQSTGIMAPRKEIRGLKSVREGKKSVASMVLQDFECFFLFICLFFLFQRKSLASSHYCLRIVFTPTDLAS